MARLYARADAYAQETVGLFAAMALIVGFVGWLIGGALGVLVALGFTAATAKMLASLPPQTIMRLQGARPLPPAAAPGLHAMLAHVAARAGLRRVPALYLLPTDLPNAFATGDGHDPAIALSRGLVTRLGDRELLGVLAHEVAHIQAGDTPVLRLAAALAETTRTVAQVGLLTCGLAFLLGQDVPVALPVVFALAPTLAIVLLLRLSRGREFAADAAAVALTGDARGLATALHRLDRFRSRLRALGYGVGRAPSWLATHPPMPERLARLRDLAPTVTLSPQHGAGPGGGWRWR